MDGAWPSGGVLGPGCGSGFHSIWFSLPEWLAARCLSLTTFSGASPWAKITGGTGRRVPPRIWSANCPSNHILSCFNTRLLALECSKMYCDGDKSDLDRIYTMHYLLTYLLLTTYLPTAEPWQRIHCLPKVHLQRPPNRYFSRKIQHFSGKARTKIPLLGVHQSAISSKFVWRLGPGRSKEYCLPSNQAFWIRPCLPAELQPDLRHWASPPGGQAWNCSCQGVRDTDLDVLSLRG